MKYEFISFEQSNNISLLQFLYSPANTFNYITSSNAISKKFIELTEINDSGRVNDIIVNNNSEYYVFFSDGDILVGAKQNRVLNTSILLPPNSKRIINVSCIEHGRWRFNTNRFDRSDNYSPNFIRKQKNIDVFQNVKRKSGFYADQSKVWNSIDYAFSNVNMHSNTSDLSELLRFNKNTYQKVISNFKVSEKANGVAIFLNDIFLSLDIYNRTDVYQEYFQNLIQSVLNEFSYRSKKNNLINENDAKNKIEYLLTDPKITEKITADSIGVGFEERFLGNDFTGFNLIYADNLIHKSITSL
ncbi:MAG: hypothetical protein N2321_00470 [Melioribacteraceae bacterium]|nr:hypothetical protein [Melioribacteraceae bacterium]